MSQAPKKPRKPMRPVYMVCRRLVDPDTGEEVGALVPMTELDRALMRQRAVKAGHEYRVEIKRPRNRKFNSLVHVLGLQLAENVEAFAGMDSHAVIKRLQLEAGLFCIDREIDASPVVSAVLAAAETVLGEKVARMLAAVLPEIRTVTVKEAESLSFDTMDEADFKRLYEGICRLVADRYWPGLDPEAIEAMADLMPQAA